MNKLTSAVSKLGNKLVAWSSGSAYAGGETTRYRTQHAHNRSRQVDEENNTNRYYRASQYLELRDLYRNNPIVRGVVQRHTDNIIGSGIWVQAKTSSDEWNKVAEAWFANWSKGADIRGRLSIHDMARICIYSRLIEGDCGFVLTKEGKLQPIENERIVTPDNVLVPGRQIVEGVQVDPVGRIDGFHIGDRDESGLVNREDTEYIENKNFIHMAQTFRFDQLRGVPELAPVLTILRDHDELAEATVLKAKLSAFRAFTLKRKAGAYGPANLGNRLGNSGADFTQVPPLERMGKMQVYHLTPEEDVQDLESKTPHNTYTDFIEQLLRTIGASLGLPYEMLLMDFSKGSYASSRAALLQAYNVFNCWQEWVITNFYQRIWNWRIAKAILDGTLPSAPVDDRGISEWYKVDFITPSRSWVDPNREQTANEKAYLLGQTSLTQLIRAQGYDIEDVLEEKGNDIMLATRIAQNMSEKTGVQFSWRDLITATSPGLIANFDAPPDVNNSIGDQNVSDSQ